MSNPTIKNSRIDFGTLEPKKPFNKQALLEKFRDYMIYEKRFSPTNIHVNYKVAEYLLKRYDLSKINFKMRRCLNRGKGKG